MRKITFLILTLAIIPLAILGYNIAFLGNLIITGLSIFSVVVIILVAVYFNIVPEKLYEFLRQGLSGEASEDTKKAATLILLERECNHLISTFKGATATVRKMFSAFMSFLEDISEWLRALSERSTIMSEQITTLASSNEKLSEEFSKILRSIEDIRGNFETLTKSTASTYEKISERQSYSEEILSNLEETVNKLNSVAESVIKTYNNVNNYWGTLESVLKNISSITNEISRIAKRTSILAINASIEATRVGESGSGFAVVAENIEKLSSETKLYAERIDEISSDIIRKANTLKNELKEGSEVIENFKAHMDAFAKATSEGVEKLAEALSDTMNDLMHIEDLTKEFNELYNFLSSLRDSLEEAQQMLNKAVSISKDFDKFLKEEVLKIERSLDRVKSNLRRIEESVRSGAQKIIMGEPIENALRSIYKDLEGITTLVYAAIDGKGMFTYPRLEVGVGFDYTKRPWYLEAKRKMKETWVEPYLDYNVKDYVVTFSYPIVERSTFKGVVCADIMLRKLF